MNGHDEDDKDARDLWDAVVESVDPIHPEKPASKVIKSTPKPSSSTKTFKTQKHTQVEVSSSKVSANFEDHSDIDRRTYQRLKRGQIQIEATLDLHGLSLREAYNQALNFISRCYMGNKRCVLIITGKGRRQFNRDVDAPKRGVIRDALPGWLEDAPLKSMVLKYSHAVPKDGGQGAFYVYLRRNR